MRQPVPIASLPSGLLLAWDQPGRSLSAAGLGTGRAADSQQSSGPLQSHGEALSGRRRACAAEPPLNDMLSAFLQQLLARR